MTITFEIQFNEFDIQMDDEPVCEKQMDKVLEAITEKYATEIDDLIDYGDGSFETFFDIYFKKEDEDEDIDNEYRAFLAELREKYPKAGLSWYVSDRDYEED